MRIFDLLNDGDAAVALLASAQGAGTSNAVSTKSSSTYSWEAPAGGNHDPPQPNGALAFLLNDRKPWKPQPVVNADAALAFGGLKKTGKMAMEPEHKTMSIFDIVATKPNALLLHPQPGSGLMEKAKPVAVAPEEEVAVPACNKRAFERLNDLEHRAATPKRVRTTSVKTMMPPRHPKSVVQEVVENEVEEDEQQTEENEHPTDNQAVKRQRQRVLFRRNYYKRMNTIAEMREVRAELEEEYEQLMWKRNAEQMVQTYLRKGQVRQPGEQVREAYMELCRAKDSLRTENAALERVLQEVGKVHDKMRWLVDAEGGLRAEDHLDLTQCPIACQGADPLTRVECEELSTQSRDLILRHFVVRNGNAAVQQVLGWNVRRQQFLAQRVLVADKCVAKQSPDKLASTVWQCVAEANESMDLRTIVGKALVRQTFIVQRVDKNHNVLYLALGNDKHALCLVSKSEHDKDDKIITVQGLPAPCAAPGTWIEDLMAWVRFSKEEDETRVNVGTALPAGASHQEEHWLRLLVVASMQLETKLGYEHQASPCQSSA